MNPAPRLCVMLSGGGRTLLNLCDAIDAGDLHARVALVLASRPCQGLVHARARGLDARLMPGDIPVDDLNTLLRAHTIAWVILAGYLRHVRIPHAYRGRVVNIHPALLPKFGGQGMHGRHVHEAVLAARESESGCTVHLCTDEYDQGPILLQLRCPVLPDDTPDTLASRVFELECRAYPAALASLFADHPNPPSTG